MEFDTNSFFVRNDVIFHRKCGLKKIGVLICYSHQLWAQCIKMCDHLEFAYFVGPDYYTNVIFQNVMFLKKNNIFF